MSNSVVIQEIISYIHSNPKQCGIKNENVNIKDLVEYTKKIELHNNDTINNGLYFDIIRECIYRKNINFNSKFNKSVWYSIFTENFFKNCIHCNNTLTSVNWACCDIFCKSCKSKYECKSLLSYYDYNRYIKINLGQICGVYDFLENDKSVIVLHFLDGYYILSVNKIKNNNIRYKIINKNNKKLIKNFENYNDLKTYIMNNNFIDYNISKHFSIEIFLFSNVIKKIKTQFEIDIKNIFLVVEQINKIYPCLQDNENIISLLSKFII